MMQMSVYESPAGLSPPTGQLSDTGPALLVARRGWWRDESGQATAEYALVLLGVAAIAMLVLAWAGQTDRITGLFNAVLDSITGLVP